MKQKIIQVDKAKNVDVVMPLHNLIEYSDNYSETTRSSLKYSRDKPATNDAEKFTADIIVTLPNLAQKMLKYWYQQNVK